MFAMLSSSFFSRRSTAAAARCLAASFIALLAFAVPAAAQTDTLVSFDGHVPHTWSSSIELQGRLIRPAGFGPFPAVVVLHGSNGMWTTPPDPNDSSDLGNMRNAFDRWADLLSDNGYVVLVLDSFTDRAAGHPGPDPFQGLEPPEDADVAPVYERSRDALDALDYLRTLSYVDGDRIAVLGFSHGAGGVVGALVDGPAARAAIDPFEVSAPDSDDDHEVPAPADPPGGQGFRCGAAYYPGAAFFGYFGQASDPTAGYYRPTRPLLMLYGENDPFWENNSGHTFPLYLQQKAEHNGASPATTDPLLLASYPGLAHSFDANLDTAQVRGIRQEVLAFFDSCIPGAETGDRSGEALAAGDFDCDGKDDLAIGIANKDARGQSNAGMVKVLLGHPQGDLGLPAVEAWGEIILLNRPPGEDVVADARFGASLISGDFDADGCDDLAVGAPSNFQGEGEVHVFYGSAAADPVPPLDSASRQVLDRDLIEIPGVSAVNNRFGERLAAGDLDGDTYDDLAITIPGDSTNATNAGAVAVVYGGTNGVHSWTRNGQVWAQGVAGVPGSQEPNDGYAMRLTVGNFDADAFDDLAIGYPYENLTGWREGYVVVLPGSLNGISTVAALGFDQTPMLGTLPENYDYFGMQLTTGDLDDDGYDDLVVGSPLEDWGTLSNAGVVHVVYGGGSGLVLSGTKNFLRSHWGGSNVAVSQFGSSLATIERDFFASVQGEDLAIGAIGVAVSGKGYAGRVYMAYTNGNRTFDTTPTLPDEGFPVYQIDRTNVKGPVNATAYFGSALVSGDFDNAAGVDLAIAAYLDNIGSVTQAGTANVVYKDEDLGLITSGNAYLREED